MFMEIWFYETSMNLVVKYRDTIVFRTQFMPLCGQKIQNRNIFENVFVKVRMSLFGCVIQTSPQVSLQCVI